MTIDNYLIGVNVFGFILYLINMWLYSLDSDFTVDKLLTITSFMFGSVGILLAILLFDRKPSKEIMMSRVFVVCVCIIQVIIILMMKGYHTEEITIAFWTYFKEHEAVLVYLGIINFVTFAAFAVDKVNAATHRSRIRIVTLLGLAFIGGSIGALLAMYLLHHKTHKDYFTVGIPLIIIMQVAILFYRMNIGW